MNLNELSIDELTERLRTCDEYIEKYQEERHAASRELAERIAPFKRGDIIEGMDWPRGRWIVTGIGAATQDFNGNYVNARMALRNVKKDGLIGGRTHTTSSYSGASAAVKVDHRPDLLEGLT